MKVLKEFKEFINTGNVVDLAVAVVIGGAVDLRPARGCAARGARARLSRLRTPIGTLALARR